MPNPIDPPTTTPTPAERAMATGTENFHVTKCKPQKPTLAPTTHTVPAPSVSKTPTIPPRAARTGTRSRRIRETRYTPWGPLDAAERNRVP